MQKPHLPELIFFFVLLGMSAVAAYYVLSPYLVSIFLGAVLAILMRSVYRELHSRLAGKPSLAAGITTLMTILMVLLPLGVSGVLLVSEIENSTSNLDSHSINIGITRVQDYIHAIVPSLNFPTLNNYVGKIASYVGGNVTNVLSGTMDVAVNLLLMLVIQYFLLRDGHRLHAFALSWSPLPDRYDRTIITRVSSAVTAVVKGTLLTAIVQGVLCGIGFWMFGMSSPILWGVLTVLAALVPLVGTALVTVPWAIFMFASGSLVPAIGFTIWATVIVGGIENILRPMLIRGGLDIHPLLILLAVLGGLKVFGPVGFIAGPVALALFFALLEIYPEIVKGEIRNHNNE